MNLAFGLYAPVKSAAAGASYSAEISDLQFRNTRWNQTGKYQRFRTCIPDLVFLITGDKCGTPGTYRFPAAVPEYLSLPGMEKDFMFPVVGMAGCESICSDFKYAHAEVVRTVGLADGDPAGDAFDHFRVKSLGGGFRIVNDLHKFLRFPARGAPKGYEER